MPTGVCVRMVLDHQTGGYGTEILISVMILLVCFMLFAPDAIMYFRNRKKKDD